MYLSATSLPLIQILKLSSLPIDSSRSCSMPEWMVRKRYVLQLVPVN